MHPNKQSRTMNKAIYTVITNDYDVVPTAPKYEGWDCILFTDKEPADAKGWKVWKLHPLSNHILQSREVKILSHCFLPEYDLVCYIDANQVLKQEPPNHPIWFEHPRRTNIHEEAQAIIKGGRFDADLVNEMIFDYERRGYNDCGLYLNGFFVREHNDRINALHDEWYAETAKHLPRDQITLPMAIFTTRTYPDNIMPYRIKERFAIIKTKHKQRHTEPVNQDK